MSVFHFKEFSIEQSKSAMKVGTDAMVLGSLIETEGHSRALDVGTGTGVLSLMLAQKNQLLSIDAVEKDKHSVEECQKNFISSKWRDRLTVHHADLAQFVSDTKFDLIFSNPPYYDSKMIGTDRRQADTKHTDSLPIPLFISRVSEFLSENGSLWIIIQSEFENKWINEAEYCGLHLTNEIRIRGKEGGEFIRKVLRFNRQQTPFDSSNLTIRTNVGSYTEEYKELTKSFHGTTL